jgi:subtilisin family serine protease
MNRSISTIKADLAHSEFGATGRDIVWAVIATGVDGTHPHFKRFKNCDLSPPLHHIDYSKADWATLLRDTEDSSRALLDKRFSVSRPSDVQGLGTRVAGIIAGQNDTLWQEQLMKGVAPEARILSINVFNKDSPSHLVELNVVAALQAIQHINQGQSRALIHGVIVPLAFPWDARNYACGHSPLCAEVDRTVNSGVVVVTISGNSSYDDKRGVVVEGGIVDPGNADLAITVGATHRTAPQIYGPSFFSCRGPTADGRRKPDILAPGERISTCFTPSEAPKKAGGSGTRQGKASRKPVTSEEEYCIADGTQLAAAHVAGAVAGLLSVRRELIGKPREVKGLLLRTALSLGREEMYQGAGLLDAFAALREASGKTSFPPLAARPLNIFCSYAHRDAALWQEFKAHLAPMERAGRVKVWSDGLIEPGKRWEVEIYRALDNADIVILLVSAYFVESEFCYSKELKRALEREAEGRATIVPVRVRPVSLKGTMLAEIQALPAEAKPITSFGDPHEGWTQVADRLYDLVEKLRAQRMRA